MPDHPERRQVNVWLDPDELSRLDRIREIYGLRSRSEAVRVLLATCEKDTTWFIENGHGSRVEAVAPIRVVRDA